MKKIYESWLKRTAHIDEDCNYCKNKRYLFSFPIITGKEVDLTPTMYACPSCNFDDLQITQKTKYLPLDKFVMIKYGLLNIEKL